MSFLTSFRKKKSTATRKTRASQPFDKRKWAMRFVVIALVIWGSMIALAADLPQKTGEWITGQFHALAVQSGFKLERINVTGRIYTDPQALRAGIKINDGDSLFKLDLDRAHSRIAALPWVKSVQLRREWPNRLSIRLEERTPLALWQHNGEIIVLDQTGKTIDTPVLESFSNLPILTGADAPDHAKALLDLIKAESVIAEQLDAAIRVGNRRWDLRLKNGLIIKLPEKDLSFALARIAKAQRDFLIFSKEILSLDARFSDRLIIKASSGAADRLSDYISSAQSSDTISVSP